VRLALLAVAVLVAVGAGAFFAGRASVDRAETPRRSATVPRGSFAAAYRSGRESAFSGFDGGWSYGAPYIVTLRRGGPGITYRFARRWPMTSGVEYRICGREVCTRRTP
jgi:hypothetical protein